MRTFHFLRVFILTSLFFMTSCADDDTGQELQQSDNLEQYDILGEWQLEVRTINEITDAAVECCDTITLQTDEVKDDLSGVFEASGVGYQTNGEFLLNPADNKVQFFRDDEVLEYTFQVNADVLTFTYEEAGDAIDENWRKQE